MFRPDGRGVVIVYRVAQRIRRILWVASPQEVLASSVAVAHDAEMSGPETYDDQLYAHFVTFSCYRNRNLLDHDPIKRVLLGVLNSQKAIGNARILGFVIMPNHVHAMLWFPQPGQLSYFMKQWKQRSSRIIRRDILPQLPHYHRKLVDEGHFWQRKYHSFQVWSDEKLIQKINYMHLNPVRAGLVEKCTDWKWSSARYYEWKRSVGVPIEWIPG